MKYFTITILFTYFLISNDDCYCFPTSDLEVVNYGSAYIDTCLYFKDNPDFEFNNCTEIFKNTDIKYVVSKVGFNLLVNGLNVDEIFLNKEIDIRYNYFTSDSLKKNTDFYKLMNVLKQNFGNNKFRVIYMDNAELLISIDFSNIVRVVDFNNFINDYEDTLFLNPSYSGIDYLTFINKEQHEKVFSVGLINFNENIDDFMVFDIRGKLINLDYQKAKTSNLIDIRHLENGIYFLYLNGKLYKVINN